MKKFFSLLAVGVLTLSLAACGQTEGTCDADEAFKLGLVTDLGGISDESFNQGTWEGLVRFAKGYDLCEGTGYKYLQSEADADYIPNLTQFSEEKLDLIVAPGFLFAEAIAEVALDNPNQKFLIIDDQPKVGYNVVERPNVASALFAEHEGSYLAGVAAALKAQAAGEDTVGFLGGGNFDLIWKFEAGFEAGVKAIDSDMTVLYEYTNDFVDTQKGQTLAAKMYDKGAYVIYHAAGNAGNGAIKEAKDRVKNGQEVWVIGVDKDQYEAGKYDGDNSVVLTSMMKRVDLAAYEVARLTYEGKFPGGRVLTFDLSNDGVGLPSNNPNLTSAMMETINEYRLQIIDKDITVPTVPTRNPGQE